MFDSSNSSVAPKATAPEVMGCSYLISPDVIRYYTGAPTGYYDYTISTNTFSAKQMTNIPSAYDAGYAEYNPIRKRYIMVCYYEDIVTAPDLSFTTDLQTFSSSGQYYGDPCVNLQDVRTCYDDNGQWYARYRSSNATPPDAGAFTTAPVVMKKE
jgi:hypothetical protein